MSPSTARPAPSTGLSTGGQPALADSGTTESRRPDPPVRVVRALREEQWWPLARAHEEAVDALTADHRLRRSHDAAHPVEDFLFTYYRQKPSALRRWHPGVGVALVIDDPAEAEGRLALSHHAWVAAVDDRGRAVEAIGLDVPAFLERRGSAVRFATSLLAATASRAPQLGCFGLHEWAMVHRSGDAAGGGGGMGMSTEVRHGAHPLRLGAEGTDAVVEEAARSGRLRCSHVDAFRFYAPSARPLNTLQPSRETQVALEQPGCLHATMDLYKWAYSLTPAVPSALVLECFLLARDVRELDMRASPYDFAELGRTPVRIETPAGRAQYAVAQRGFADRAAPLRERLLAVCESLSA